MKLNDVVTVVAATGEYVGKLVKIDGPRVVLANPRMITFAEQGMGFAHGVAMTGNTDPKEITILQAVFVTETNDEVVKAWYSATSGIVLP